MTAQSPTGSRARLAGLLARRPDFRWLPGRPMAVSAVVIAVLAYVLVAWNARYPAIPLDEIVMVGNSRIIAGLPATWQLQDSGFMPGLAILMAPAWWFTSDPATVYRVGIVIAAALGVAAIWPLSRIATRVGASPTLSVVAASVVAVAPARVLFSNYLLSESLFLVMTASVLVAGARLAERPTWQRGLVLGLATGGAVLAHGRGVALAVAVGLWCLLMLRRAGAAAVLAGLTALLASMGAYGIYVAVTSRVIATDSRVSGTLEAVPGVSAADVVATIIGQGWYMAFAWWGTATVGLLWVGWRFRTRPFATLVGLATVTSFALSTYRLMPREGVSRFDVWFYGRYNDHLWVVLAMIGIVLLVRLRWPLVSALTVLVTVVSSIAMLAVTVPRVSNGPRWVEVHVLGIAPWLSLDAWAEDRAQPWLFLCGIAVLLTVIVVAAALWRALVIPALMIGWLGLSLWHDVLGLDIRDGRSDGDVPPPAVYSYVSDDQPVGIDRTLGSLANMMFFQSGGQALTLVDIDDVPDDVEVLYSWIWETVPAERGARLLDSGQVSSVATWVYPGDVYDELDSLGALLSPEESAGWANAKGE